MERLGKYSEETVIEFSGVSKQFKNHVVLNNINLRIPRKSSTAILGANGAGKTTLLRIISSLYFPTSGIVNIDGRQVNRNDFRQVRKKIGLMLGGEPSLFQKMTARENIHYYGMLQGMNAHEAKEKADVLCSRLSMQGYADCIVDSFSRGMKQKVLFAQTIVHEPEILILDEPSTGLDIFSILDIQRMIAEYHNAGRTILLSSHNMDEVERLCDYIIILDNGEVAFQGKKRALLKSKNVDSLHEAFSTVVYKRRET